MQQVLHAGEVAWRDRPLPQWPVTHSSEGPELRRREGRRRRQGKGAPSLVQSSLPPEAGIIIPIAQVRKLRPELGGQS